MMQLSGKNFIGQRQSSKGSTMYAAVSPAQALSIEPLFFEATADEVNEAAELAATAFPFYSRVPGAKRAEFLESIAQSIMDLGEDLLERCMLETGLPMQRLTGERGRTVNQLRLFASYIRDGHWVDARIDHADPTRTPPRPDLRSMLIPVGPVGVFGASNFPLAFSVAGGDTVSALAAGCTVVFKGHPAHPGTSEMIAGAIISAIQKSNLPDGVFSLVQGKSNAVGEALVTHPEIKAIGFTGSFRGGKAIFDLAAKREIPIPVYAEMGSTNPVFILPGAMKERGEAIARDLTQSVTLGTGQFCTNPGLVIIPAKETELIGLLAKSFSDTPCGLVLTPAIRESFHDGIRKMEKAGARVITKGKDAGEGLSVSPHLFQTTAKEFLEEKTLEEELFGPSTLAVIAESSQQISAIAKRLGGHLTATVHGTEEDLKEYSELLVILSRKVGRLIINGYPTGVEVAHAMVHGGPFPATTDSRSTSVGTNAITRFARPVCYQNFPDQFLPSELQEGNSLGIKRLVDGKFVM